MQIIDDDKQEGIDHMARCIHVVCCWCQPALNGDKYRQGRGMLRWSPAGGGRRARGAAPDYKQPGQVRRGGNAGDRSP
jgi:hypothetical protein